MSTPQPAAIFRNDSVRRRHWLGLPMTEPIEGIEQITLALPHFGRQPFAMTSLNGDEVGVNPYLDTVYRMGTRPGERAIPVGVVSKNYRLVDHQLLLTTVQQALFANDIDMNKVHVTANWTIHGERAHFSFFLPEEDRFLHLVDGKKDLMRFRIEAFNSVEGSFRLMIIASWLRLVCTNGLMVQTDLMDVRKQHRQQLQIEDIGRLLHDAIDNVQRDKGVFAAWQAHRVNQRALIQWIDEDVRERWNVTAAVRVLGIARTGHDVTPTGDLKRSPSEIATKVLGGVPGILGPVENVFGISQVLSWIAGQRAETAEDLEWRTNVPELIAKLLDRTRSS